MADEEDDQQTTDDQGARQTDEMDQQTSQDQVTDKSTGQTTDDQGGDQQTTDDQSQGQQATDDQGGGEQTTGDQSQDQQTTDDQGASQQTTADQSEGEQTTADQGGGQTTDSSAPATGGSEEAVTPDKEYVDKVLTGAVGISKVSEAAAIIAGAETVVEAIEPIGAVIEVVHMVLSVWNALETPDRTCSYQGLVYGLMYAALGKGDPRPNPTWPDLKAAPYHDEKFFEGVAEAKKRLANGQSGTRIKNLILLDVAKRGEKAVINNLWQHAIPDDDHLLRMYTIEWPNVGPNG